MSRRFSRKKLTMNFSLKFSIEFYQKFRIFSCNVLLEVIPKSFVRYFRATFNRKSKFMYEISEISTVYAVFVHQLAFVSKKKGGSRRSFVVEEGPPRYALQYRSNNSVRTHISRRAAPGRSSAVPSGSLSRR